MIVTHKLEFDLAKPCPGQHIKAMQKDAMTRAVEATLKCNGQPWAVPAGVKVAVAFSKRGGTSGLYDELPDGRSAISYSADRAVVTAVLAPEVFTAPGQVFACLTLMDNALNKLSTFPFEILVEANPSADGVVSQNYYNYQDLADINDHLQGIIEGTFPIYTDKTLTASQRPAEAKATGDAIAALAADLSAADDSSAVVAEATGGTITLNDASNRLLHGLTVYGKTTQNGTPSPENPAALVNAGEGGNINVSAYGKNLFGGVFGTRYPLFIPAGTAIVASTAVGDANSYLYLFRADGSTITYASVMGDITAGGAARKYRTLTLTEDVYAVLFQTNDTGDYQIELGSVATAYETYKASQTLTVPTPNGLPGIPVISGGNYTDESGQEWIAAAKDLGNNKDVPHAVILTLTGAENWIAGTNPNAGMKRYLVAGEMLGRVAKKICSHFPYVNNSAYDGKVNGVYNGDNAFRSCDFAVATETWPNLDSWKAWLAAQYKAGTPVQICYAPAEPAETALDDETVAAYAALHTNKPNTTITNNAGAGMNVEYMADTKAYIDNKFAALTAAMMA